MDVCTYNMSDPLRENSSPLPQEATHLAITTGPNKGKAKRVMNAHVLHIGHLYDKNKKKSDLERVTVNDNQN